MQIKSKQPIIALFIPTFNSAGTILQLLNAIPRLTVKSFAIIYIIDNNSRDQTISLVRDFSKIHPEWKIKIFLNSENYLLGGSTILALKLAIEDKIDYLVCMHSDGQADPRDLKTFVQYCIEDRYDFILGSRLLATSQTVDYSRLRWWANWVFAKIQQPLLKSAVFDLGAYVAFNLETVKNFKFSAVKPDMGYHPLLILNMARVSKNPLRFKEFAIHWGKVETSSVNILTYGVKHLGRLLLLYLQHPKLTVDYSQGFHTRQK